MYVSHHFNNIKFLHKKKIAELKKNIVIL